MLAEYILQNELGQGSFGVVKLARHQTTSQKVAIKFASRDEIQKEFKVLSSLDHPNIIRVSKVIPNIPVEMRVKNTHEQAFVMDYLEGGDLVDLLGKQGGKLPQNMALKFLVQILSAVSYLHNRGISHRDIKPDNLLFDAAATNIVLSDFGLAESSNPNQPLFGSTGSLVYSAPEVLRGKRYRGTEADMWSVGVVFYCMLTGCIPWEGDNIHQQLNNALKGKFCRMACLSPECEELVACMLQVDPKKRPTADEVLHCLSECGIRTPPTSKLKIAMHRSRTD